MPIISGSTRSLALDAVIRPAVRPLLRSPLVPPQRRVAGVTFLGGGTRAVSTSATSLSISKAGLSLKVGDLLLLVQLCFQTPTTPTGFTQLGSSTSGSFSQKVYLWGKTIATSGETTTSVGIGQASAAGMSGFFLAFRGATGTPVVGALVADAQFQANVNPEPILPTTPTADGICVALCACNVTGSNALYTPSSGWTTPYGALTNARVGVATQPSKAGVAVAGTILSSFFPNGTTVSWNRMTFNVKKS